MGDCTKFHDPALRADYEMASKLREHGYEDDVSIHAIFNGIFIFTAERLLCCTLYERSFDILSNKHKE